MCVRAWCDTSTGLPLVLAGFDDGSLLLWEARRPSSELTSIKLFSEPGERSVRSRRLFDAAFKGYIYGSIRAEF